MKRIIRSLEYLRVVEDGYKNGNAYGSPECAEAIKDAFHIVRDLMDYKVEYIEISLNTNHSGRPRSLRSNTSTLSETVRNEFERSECGYFLSEFNRVFLVCCSE